jgi:predicted Zn finger-like uncharacterized protein
MPGADQPVPVSRPARGPAHNAVAGIFGKHRLVILACPSCATRFRVDDRLLGADGRRVRCSVCHREWRVPPAEHSERPTSAVVRPTDPGEIHPPSGSGAGLAHGAYEPRPVGHDEVLRPQALPSPRPHSRKHRQRSWWLIPAAILVAVALLITWLEPLLERLGIGWPWGGG